MSEKVFQQEELSALEQAFLGVLALGLPPASLARDPSLKLDVLAATAVALAEGKAEDFYLNQDGESAADEFGERLSGAAIELDAKKVIALGAPPGINVSLMGGIGDGTGWRRINFEHAPRIFDKYLAHACLESLLRQPPVHAYLMRKYGDGSEIWQRLMREGYGSGPGP